MYLLVLLASLLLSHFTVSALNVSSTELVEQLFLDFSLEEISLNNTDGFPIVEPWASDYLNAIRDGRFGDAVWARYHIAGDVHSRTGLIEGTNLTVLESIREDALGYRSGDQDLYAEAVELYEKTNRTDGHKNIIRMLKIIGDQDIDEVQAELNKRTTWSIKCSTNYLAYKSSCLTLLENMSTAKTYIGSVRRLGARGTCNFRVGPYRGSSTDLTYYRAHAVGELIEEECTYCPACTTVLTVSGYSPKNSGHRKVCLSSKRTGCHS